MMKEPRNRTLENALRTMILALDAERQPLAAIYVSLALELVARGSGDRSHTPEAAPPP